MKKSIFSTVVLIFAIIFAAVGIAITTGYLIKLGNTGWSIFGDGDLSIEKTGAFGDYIGGFVGTIFAFISFIMLLFNLLEQRKSFKWERFETRFFDMIKFHRENVEELSYTTYKRTIKKSGKKKVEKVEVKETFVTRKVFKAIFDDFKTLNKELEHFFKDVKEENIYEEGYLKNLRNNEIIQNRHFSLLEYAKVDILYCILYFGLSSEDQETIKNFFKKRYKESFYKPIIQFASLKPKEESKYWGKWVVFSKKELNRRMDYFHRFLKDRDNNVISPQTREEWVQTDEIEYVDIYHPNYFVKYYGGHQFRLGHYFRHLYQSVTFINESKLINYNEKYSNIKLLRGQLSTYEQSIIFLNSISVLGRIWEFENRENPDKTIAINNQLITKYNFIKNILNDTIIDNISVSQFYPLVEFEANFSEEKKNERKLLEKQYS